MPISDYRFDPYNNVIVPFQINSETHIIPSNAPYVIRLNEVPLKESPSSLTVKFENNTALTEVSASPAAGQFWPDFNTADQNWNTGTLKFNVADAGKVVKVSYKGTGTLAGVKSNRYPSWWLERGDGSLGDKVCTNGEVFEGVYNFKSFTVPAGVTIYVNLTAKILCQDAFINNGVVGGGGRAISNIGYFGGCGAMGLNGNRSGAGGKGYGAAGTYHNYQSGYAGSASVAMIARVMVGGIHSFVCGSQGGTGGQNIQDRPGGAGGMGGAGIVVVAKTIYNTGVINSDGAPGGWNSGYAPGSGQGGGGGGGVIILIADKINHTGTITVNGGNNGASAGWYKLIELGVM